MENLPDWTPELLKRIADTVKETKQNENEEIRKLKNIPIPKKFAADYFEVSAPTLTKWRNMAADRLKGFPDKAVNEYTILEWEQAREYYLANIYNRSKAAA